MALDALTIPTDKEQLADSSGKVTRNWFLALQALKDRINGPVRVPEYAPASAPKAANYGNCVIRVTGTNGLVYSDGVNWRAVSTNAVVI